MKCIDQWFVPLIELPSDTWVQVFDFMPVLDLIRNVRRVKCMKLLLWTYGSLSANKWPCFEYVHPVERHFTGSFFVYIIIDTSNRKRDVLLHSDGWIVYNTP